MKDVNNRIAFADIAQLAVHNASVEIKDGEERRITHDYVIFELLVNADGKLSAIQAYSFDTLINECSSVTSKLLLIKKCFLTIYYHEC